MPLLIESIAAIAHLNRQGLHHGDIRADHIIISSDSGAYAWIDFDYAVDHPGYDVYCLGKVLQKAVGKGRHSPEDIRLRPGDYPLPARRPDAGGHVPDVPSSGYESAQAVPLYSGSAQRDSDAVCRRCRRPLPTKVDDLREDLRSLFPSPQV